MEPPLPPSPVVQVERAVAPISFPDVALERVLRKHLFPPGTNPEYCHRLAGVRYVYNRIDLDGDRAPETLVALLGPQTCGKEGCPVLLLKHFGRDMSPLQTLTGFHSLLVVSQSRSEGWRDLILPQPDTPPGGPSPVLSHSGEGYVRDPGVRGVAQLGSPPRGIAALVLKSRPSLVQGHPLGCAVDRLDQPLLNETKY